MTRNFNTPLALIMHHLHISSVELASAIHVDPSLISRWKNKKRPFNSSSVHYSSIINFILEYDKRLEYRNIALFLSDYIPNITFSSRQDVYQALDLWLSGYYYQCPSEHSIRHLHEMPITSVSIIKGDQEKKEALLHILDITLSFNVKKKLYLLFDDSTDDLLVQSSFYELWIQRLHEIIRKGHDVYFIYNSNSAYSNIVNLHNFLYLTQFPNYHAYFLRKNAIPYFDLYVLDETLAMTSFSAVSDGRKGCLFSFSHLEIVKQMKKQFENILLYCEKPFSHNEHINIPRVFQPLKSIAYIKQRVMFYTTSPFNFPVTPKTFKKVLEYNRFTAKDISSTLEEYESIIYNPFTQLRGDFCTYLMNTDSFHESIHKPSYNLFPKLLSDKEIILPKELYSLYIEEFLKYLYAQKNIHSNSSMAVISDKAQKPPKDIFIYAVNNLCTYISSDLLQYGDNHLVITSPLFTNDIYDYLEHLHIEMSEDNYNNNRLIVLLNQILHDLQK